MRSAYGSSRRLSQIVCAIAVEYWTACGVFDGFFELGLAAWDVAAGGLLVREAGGVGPTGTGPTRSCPGTSSRSPAVHEALLAIASGAE
jgi:fructose-1,6-bisphosphatase/inositol monophosphatase family enzyme